MNGDKPPRIMRRRKHCKHCAAPIQYGHFGWYHVNNGWVPCEPSNPKSKRATP